MPRVLPAVLSACLAVGHAGAQVPGLEPAPPTDKEIRRAWSNLLAEEQRDVVEWLRLELQGSDSFQRKLVRLVLDEEERDPGLWPLGSPPPIYDPEEHAPGQPIARKLLEPDSRKAERARAALLGEPDPRALRSAWVYDWGTGELRREGEMVDPERLFENALNGYPPDLDLARALVLRRLDRGEERVALAAFSHAYADRDGDVVPGVTLYDAWASGKTIETPDVECLGIVHDVLDDWRRWKAPVPASKHRELYDTIEGIFEGAHAYRSLREALADAYLLGEPARGTYDLLQLHALWERHQSVPSRLAKDLPSAERTKKFLADWTRVCARNEKLREAAATRRDYLVHGGALVRATLVSVLERYGAFERKRRPRR